MTDRKQVIERLLAAHETWFDVERDHAFAGHTFPGFAEFHSTASRYVLVKRAKLWGASAHEYLFFCDTPHLTESELADLVAFMTGDALGKVQLSPDHMSSYLSLVVVADTADEEALRLARRTRFRKNFALGFKGWADLRLAVIDLGTGQVATNAQGKALRETLAANAFACDEPASPAPLAAAPADGPSQAGALAASASSKDSNAISEEGRNL